MVLDFKGIVSLVAGGTGGLGRAVTLAFLEEQAKVHVTYRNQEELDGLRMAVPRSKTIPVSLEDL